MVLTISKDINEENKGIEGKEAYLRKLQDRINFEVGIFQSMAKFHPFPLDLLFQFPFHYSFLSFNG